jgi:hypothetical protein
MRCPSLAAAVLALSVMLVESPAFAPQLPTVEAQVKAAFLYNFAQFIQWPRQAFTGNDAPFVICTAGGSFDGALEKTVEGEMLNGRRISIRRLGPAETARGCQVLYIGKTEAHRSAEIVGAVANAPVLTVGDVDNFIDVGGMIRFTEAGHRIRFEINPEAVERASLRVSSRLLRLADIARPRQGTALR